MISLPDKGSRPSSSSVVGGRVEQLARLVGRHLVGGDVVADRGAARRLGHRRRLVEEHLAGSRVDAGRGDLHEVRSVATDADDHPVAGAGIVEISRASISPRSSTQMSPSAEARLVAEVDPLQPGDPLLVAVGDPVEVLLHGGGEVVVTSRWKALLEQARHGERQPGRYQGVAAGAHVATVLGIVPMIDAYVDGRPIPFSSMAFTPRVASV